MVALGIQVSLACNFTFQLKFIGLWDEYLDPVSGCTKCANQIYGCNRCTLQNNNANTLTNFLVCQECSDGLYLLQNRTHVSIYPTLFTTCVPDCRQAQSSFINDPTTGICQWCGEHCISCTLAYGCQSCLGETTGKSYTNYLATTQHPVSTYQMPTPAANLAFPSSFKLCRPCTNTQYCQRCDTNPDQNNVVTCDSWNTLYGSAIGGSARPGGSFGYSNPGSLDGQCLAWNSVNCQLCSDFYTLFWNAGLYDTNAWTGWDGNYDACQPTAWGGNTCMTPYPGYTDHCKICTYFYGEVTQSNGRTYCQYCHMSTSTTWFYEAVKCSATATPTCSGTPGTCYIDTINGCRDGYIDPTTPNKCTPTCGRFYYGAVSFGSFAQSNFIKDSSYCVACHSDCWECVGAANTQCLSCRNKNYYLLKTNALNNYGSCQPKEIYGSYSKTLYVNPVTAVNALGIQSITGEWNNPFNSIQDAMLRGYELSALYKQSVITIVLYSGLHAMVRDGAGTYMPIRTDDWSQNVKFIIQSQVTNQPVRVLYKLRDLFTFKVGYGIHIKDVIFDGSDSIMTPSTTTRKILLQDKLVSHCNDGADNPLFNTNCYFTREPTEECYINQGANFFYFDVSTSPISRTQLVSPPTLKLERVQFINFMYEFSGFIEMNGYGGHVEMYDTVFKNINTCGSIIRNKKKYIYNINIVRTGHQVAYNERATNYPGKLINDNYNEESVNPYTASNCDTVVGSTKPCFSIKIQGCSFLNFGQQKTAINYPILVDLNRQMQYQGMVLDLLNFQGNIWLESNTFDSNILRYGSCNVADDMASNDALGLHASNDRYPNFSGARNRLQIRSVLSIVKHNHRIEIVKNTFTKNSGTKGIIYLDIYDRAADNPVVIAHNTFTRNAGYLDASVIFIRARGLSTQNVLSLVPNVGSLFCTGYHFQENTFTENFGCPKYAGSAIKIECVNYADTSSAVNDRITHGTLSASAITGYTQLPYPTYLPAVPLQSTGIILGNNGQYTYGGVTKTLIVGDMQQVTFYKNVFTANHASGGNGLLDFIGVPRVFFESDIFTNNGDSIKEATSLYGGSLNANNLNTFVGDLQINLAYGQSNSLFCKGMIRINRAREVSLTDLKFTNNWLLETDYDPLRAQIMILNQFYGQVSIRNKLQVINHIGMNNAYVTGTLGASASFSSTPAINLQASMQPLIKWQSTDNVLYFKLDLIDDPLIPSGDETVFRKVYYYQPMTVNPDRLFWPELSSPVGASITYVTQNFNFIKVTLDDIQCFACTVSPIKAHSQAVKFTDVTMTNINSFSYTYASCGTACQQSAAFFAFQIRTQNLQGDETVTLTRTQLDTFRGGCSDGRLFDFIHDTSGAQWTNIDPNFYQLQVIDSRFNDVKMDCNGAWAKIQLADMRVKIFGGPTMPYTFQDIHAGYTNGAPVVAFGGVIYSTEMRYLLLQNVKARQFQVMQTLLTNGGGRFFYLNQVLAQQFELQITGSEFTCYWAAYTSSSEQSQVRLGLYEQGSCIHVNNNGQDITTYLSGNQFTNCYRAHQGGAIYLTSTALKTIDLTSNIFTGNVAIYGGSIFCDKCQWRILLKNQFYSGIAQYGGDIYFKEPTNYSPLTNSLLIQSHLHQGSIATSQGGALYLYDARPSIIVIMSVVITPGVASSFISNQCVGTGCSGGAIAITVVSETRLNIEQTTLDSNSADANGGGIYIDNTLTQALSLTLTSNTIQTNTAKTSGGFFYVSQTALSTTTFVSNCQFLANTATIQHGGVFYLSSQSSNTLTFDHTSASLPVGANSLIDTSKAGIDGGAIYMIGAINLLSLDAKTKVKNSEATGGSGGVIYLSGSLTSGVQTMNIVGTIIENSFAKTGTGGVAKVIGKDALVNVITDSQITNSGATSSHGGVFHFATTNQALLYITDSKIKTMSANGKGGLAYFEGADNQAFVNGATTLINFCSPSAQVGATLSGGLFYMQGITTNKVEIKTSSKIQDFVTTSHGGLLYLAGTSQQVTFYNVWIDRVTSLLGEGGLLFSAPTVTSLNVGFNTAIIAGVNSRLFGSMISMRKGMTTPSLTFSSVSSSFSCQTVDLELQRIAILASLDISTSNIGGAFYFEGVTSLSTVTSTSNTYYNCYTADQGAIYYLPQGLTLTDNGSIFKQNAGLSGQIFCVSCSASFTNSQFRDSYALDGSVVYMQDNAIITLTDSIMFNGAARRNGGAFYATGTAGNPTLTLICSVPTMIHSQYDVLQKGGFMYVNHPNLALTLTGCSYNHFYSDTTGGFIEGIQLSSFTISTCTNMKNITARLGGSFFQSSSTSLTLFQMTGCNFYCRDPAPTLTALPPAINIGSLVELTNAGTVTSTDNTFQNCYHAPQGSIFKLTQCTGGFTQTRGSFINNAADQGGAVYLDQTSALFDSTLFRNNWAREGGTMYLSGTQNLQLKNCRVESSSSTQKGGLIYAQEASGTLNINVFVTNPIISAGAVEFMNIQSTLGQGGAFYLNGIRTSLSITGFTSAQMLKFTNIHSLMNGGMIYTNGQLGINLKWVDIQTVATQGSGGVIYSTNDEPILLDQVQIANVFALQDGGIMNIQKATTIEIKGVALTSIIDQVNVQNGKGGLIYIESTATSLSLVKITNLVATNTKSKLSGSMIYSASPSVTFDVQNNFFSCNSIAWATSPTIGPATIGGAFFIKDAVIFNSLINEIKYCYLSDTGGAFHIERSKLVDSQSTIKSNQAIQGGAITCKECIQITITQTQFTNHEASTSSGKGGIMYIDAPQGPILLDSIKVVDAQARFGSGGFIHAESTISPSTPAKITIKNSFGIATTLEQLYAQNYGGGIYMDHDTLDIDMMNDVINVRNTKADFMGGFFYILKARSINIAQVTFKDLAAPQAGAFLYSISTSLQLKVQNSVIQCQDPAPVWSGLSVPLSPPFTSLTGGAFHIESATTMTDVSGLTLSQCYTGQRGGAFTLISTDLKDRNSQYSYNGAKYGGAICCQSCLLDLGSNQYTYHEAYDGGTFHLMQPKTPNSLVQQSLTISQSIAYNDGGVFHVSGTSLQTLDVSEMIIQNVKAFNNGGSFFIDNPSQILVTKDVQVTNSNAEQSGGVFYINQASSITISQTAGGLSKYQTFSAKKDGSFMNSISPNLVLILSDTLIECQITSLSYSANIQGTLDQIPPISNPRGGAFNIQGALSITSSNNIYEKCYVSPQGAVFTIVNTVSMTETGSYYHKNAAIKGGVIYAENTQMTFTDAKFEQNYGYNGSVFYIQDKVPLTIGSTQFFDSQALGQGGIGYFKQRNSLTPPTFISTDMYQIHVSSPNAIVTEFKNSQSLLRGGAFYIDSEQIDQITFDNVIQSNSFSSTKEGGLIFINQIAGDMSIINSKFQGFKALLDGSFLHSTDPDFDIVISNSLFECSTVPYDFGFDQSQVASILDFDKGGAFYIANSLTLGVQLTSNEFKNCYKCNQGGSFTLINSKLSDSGSKFNQNAAVEGGVFKCDKCQIDLVNSEIRNNEGYNGGVLNSINEITMTATNTIVSNNDARYRGGALYVNDVRANVAVKSSITFNKCKTLERNKADYGGFAYFDNKMISLKFQDSNIQNHTAFKRSAFLDTSNIDELILYNIIMYDTRSPDVATMYSTARTLNMKVYKMDLKCDTLYLYSDSFFYLNRSSVPSSTHNTKFYIEAAYNVSIDRSQFSMCGTSLNGGVFQLTQGTRFNDAFSLFENNAGANGGVIQCSNCKMDLFGTKMKWNLGWRGGVIEIKDYGYMRAKQMEFQNNEAYYTAGVIFINSFAWMDLFESEFLNNKAIENSAIEVLDSSRSNNITIYDCYFEKNTALRNTISLSHSNVFINNSRIIKNSATYLTKHLFIGFSNVYIQDTQFRGFSTLSRIPTEETLGSHIYAILSSNVNVKNSYFLDGSSKLGGAIYVEGNSSIEFEKSTFQKNWARKKGGAIYGNGFNRIKIGEASKFIDNIAEKQADDIYVAKTEGYLIVDGASFTNPQASQSIYAENVNVSLINTNMQNIGTSNKQSKFNGAGLNCFDCRALLIMNSKFSNIKAIKGGAIYIEETQDNKWESDRYGKYRILGSQFSNCQGVAGGAIYLKNPQFVTMDSGCRFQSNTAKNTTDQTLKNVRGAGGAIFYECDENTRDCLFDMGQTAFTSNFAEIKGGAIHWDTLEPIFGGLTSPNYASNQFRSNKAGRYGDNISTFPTTVAIIKESDYKQTLFQSTSVKQRDDSRLLQSLNDGSLIVQNVSYQTEDIIQDQRSGGTIPKMYLAILDKYGQIVSSDDDSRISVMIDAFASNSEDQTKFPPFIEGSTQYDVRSGVVQVSEITFAATPGYNYSVRFGSEDIKRDKVAASSAASQNMKIQNFKNIDQVYIPPARNATNISLTETDLQVKLNIGLRDCEVGEQFQWNGKCNSCPTNTSFSLVKMTEPGDCISCPYDRAICNGGMNIGPKPGYWRLNNKTSNFLPCLYKAACLGMIPPKNDVQGSCAEGYQGVLCVDCQTGYTRVRENQCAACPPKWWILLRSFLIIVVLVLLIIFLIQAQSKSRFLHVFIRLLINHVQLILLIATFNFNWPVKLQDFFDFSRPISQPFSELLSLGCLYSDPSNNTDTMKQFFSTVIFLALLPLIFAACTVIYWKARLRCKEQKTKTFIQSSITTDIITTEDEQQDKEKSLKTAQKVQDDNTMQKIVQTFTLLMTITLPNMAQFLLYSFKCIDVDGQIRLKADLEIQCWTSTHTIITFIIALPALIVWCICFPLISLWYITRNRVAIVKVNDEDFRVMNGYLYEGYKSDFYFWEYLILGRKYILISICIFMTNYGIMTQALTVLLVLVLFLVLTARKRPFVNEYLFDLEAISLATSMISVYAGLFYLADTSQIGLSTIDRQSDVTFSMSNTFRSFLLSAIVIINLVFFAYWIYRAINEMEALKGFILRACPKLYLALFACGDLDQAYLDKQKQKVLRDNDRHKEEYMSMLRQMKQIYNRGDLLLNEAVMQKLRQHMNPEKVLQIAGVFDLNDTVLTKKIQEQLLTENKGVVAQSLLFQEREQQPQKIQQIIPSLLDQQDQYIRNEQGPPNISHDDYDRYLKVLSALKNNMNPQEQLDFDTSNDQVFMQYADQLEANIDANSKLSYQPDPQFLQQPLQPHVLRNTSSTVFQQKNLVSFRNEDSDDHKQQHLRLKSWLGGGTNYGQGGVITPSYIEKALMLKTTQNNRVTFDNKQVHSQGGVEVSGFGETDQRSQDQKLQMENSKGGLLLFDTNDQAGQ